MTVQGHKNTQRIAAIDWLRGWVMILMTLDHTSWFFNADRIFADSVLLYETGSLFTTDQFLTRWVTHICAPTFVFLAGTSIAISHAQCREQGINEFVINRELFLRGAFIASLDVCLFSLVAGQIQMQVLYAIGVGMIGIVFLQRLGTGRILFLAILILASSELLLILMGQPNAEVPFWLAITLMPVFDGTYSVLYPALPWLAIMMLGWVFGQRLLFKQSGLWTAERLLMISGLAALILFIAIRSINGYGNMFMYLEGHAFIQWLHISKYPPSLAYVLLELGLMAIIFSLLMRLESIKSRIDGNGFVLVFGQTALFFYLAHFCVLALLRLILERGDLERTYWMTFLLLMILYPICRIYRAFKWRHPQSLLRFL
jgi:uncharacterized membrane protein